MDNVTKPQYLCCISNVHIYTVPNTNPCLFQMIQMSGIPLIDHFCSALHDGFVCSGNTVMDYALVFDMLLYYSHDIHCKLVDKYYLYDFASTSASNACIHTVELKRSAACNQDIVRIVEVSPNTVSYNHSLEDLLHRRQYNSNISTTLFVVTATYTRLTQRVDLTSLCHTLMLVPNAVWIVVEDSESKTESVSQLLERCEVDSVHLNAVAPPETPLTPSGKDHPRHSWKGVVQRNAGLQWLRSHYRPGNCSGVVYFADDDNKYDLRLFQEVRNEGLCFTLTMKH